MNLQQVFIAICSNSLRENGGAEYISHADEVVGAIGV